MALSVLADTAHRRAINREQVFHDHLNPLERYNEKQFIHRYRVHKDTTRKLVVILMPELYRATKRSHALEPILQLCVALWFLAAGAYCMVIGDTANISEASVHRCVKAVVKGLLQIARQKLQMPSLQGLRCVKEEFYEIVGELSPKASKCTQKALLVQVTDLKYLLIYVNFWQKHQKSYCWIVLQKVVLIIVLPTAVNTMYACNLKENKCTCI